MRCTYASQSGDDLVVKGHVRREVSHKVAIIGFRIEEEAMEHGSLVTSEIICRFKYGALIKLYEQTADTK